MEYEKKYSHHSLHVVRHNRHVLQHIQSHYLPRKLHFFLRNSKSGHPMLARLVHPAEVFREQQKFGLQKLGLRLLISVNFNKFIECSSSDVSMIYHSNWWFVNSNVTDNNCYCALAFILQKKRIYINHFRTCRRIISNESIHLRIQTC